MFIYDTETGLCVVNTGNPALVGQDVWCAPPPAEAVLWDKCHHTVSTARTFDINALSC